MRKHKKPEFNSDCNTWGVGVGWSLKRSCKKAVGPWKRQTDGGFGSTQTAAKLHILKCHAYFPCSLSLANLTRAFQFPDSGRKAENDRSR